MIVYLSENGWNPQDFGKWEPELKKGTLTSPPPIGTTFFISGNVTFAGGGFEISGNKEYGTLRESQGIGIFITDATFTGVIGVTLSNLDYGILVSDCEHAFIDQCNISNCTCAISYENCNSCDLSNSSVSNSGTGINVEFTNSSIIRDNVIANCGYGLTLRNSSSSTIRNNTFRENTQAGFYLDEGSMNNEIINNNFMNTGPNAITNGLPNNYNLTASVGGGNYWNDWTTLDDNYDGFVDSPKIFDSNNQDNLPWVIPNGWLAPVTTHKLNGTITSSGWYVSDVYVTLTPTSHSEGTIGQITTRYSFDNDTWLEGNTLTFTTAGTYQVYYYSTEAIGTFIYTEPTKSVNVKIDRKSPFTEINTIGILGDNGWFKSGVNVRISSRDM